MCKMYVVNQLNLGNRKLGYELFNGKEIVEMTEKMLKDSIVSGKEVYGMCVVNDELVLDKENFFMRNMMIHSHIGNYTAMVEDDTCIAKVFYLVIGSHTEAGKTVYDVVSSRFERCGINEEKLQAWYELGVINGGVKIENNKLVLAVQGKPEPEKVQGVAEKKEVVAKKKEETTEKKESVSSTDKNKK